MKTKKSMSLERFLKDLTLIAEYFTWHYDEEFKFIRGNKKGRIYCPITAVATVYGVHFSLDQWEDAADYLGLLEGQDVMIAADGCGGDRHELHKKLLRAITDGSKS